MIANILGRKFFFRLLSVIKMLLPIVFGGSILVGFAVAGPIEERQAVMKDVGKNMGVIVKMLKKETSFDPEILKAAGNAMAADFAKVKDLFPEGSDKGVKTGARPEIWTDRVGFDARLNQAHEAAIALAAVTEAAKLGEAVQALGGSCKACHEKFRSAE